MNCPHHCDEKMTYLGSTESDFEKPIYWCSICGTVIRGSDGTYIPKKLSGIINLWRLVSKQKPYNKKRKEDGFRWIEVLVYADDGVDTYIGEGVFYFDEERWELPKSHLNNFVVAWTNKIEIPKHMIQE